MTEKPPRKKPALRPAPWWQRLTRSIGGTPTSREDLLTLLKGAREQELVDADAWFMIQGIFSTTETQVRDIMVPRAQMAHVRADWPLDKVQRVVVDSGHSRFPVLQGPKDEVQGILLAKDLLKLAAETEADWTRWLRPAVFVPESKRVNVLLKEFRGSRNHMALVMDEYGGVAGLVTIEDVIEQIIGEISDEHDESESAKIQKQDERRWLVNGLATIEEFNRSFGSDFTSDEFHTIGGLVVHRFGRVPRRGESVTLERFTFNVQRADSRRVHLLQLTVTPQAQPAQ